MQAQYPLVPRLTQDEYEATLRHWRTKYPKTFTFQKRGESPEGFAIYLAKVTDTAVSDADKQVCLVTALHSGPEHSGTTASFALMEWLLGDSPEAAETRRRQVVLFMPVIIPWHCSIPTGFVIPKEWIPIPQLVHWERRWMHAA